VHDRSRLTTVHCRGTDKSLGLKHTYTIRLLASISPDLFPLSTLYPSKSNLRIQSYEQDTDSLESKPTPIYNTSILLDASHKSHLLYMHRLHKSCPSFRSALALWRIWGDRRGLSTRSGGGAVGWSWLGSVVLGFIIDGGEVAVLNKGEVSTRARKGLGRGLSEWQLLRAGWELLCESTLAKAIVVERSGG
jgi:U3 small nucleolar RNA-associated protein 22